MAATTSTAFRTCPLCEAGCGLEIGLTGTNGDTRVTHYRERAVPPERLIGLMAEWCGLGPRGEMAAAEFTERFDLASLPCTPITFTSADDAWLLA